MVNIYNRRKLGRHHQSVYDITRSVRIGIRFGVKSGLGGCGPFGFVAQSSVQIHLEGGGSSLLRSLDQPELSSNIPLFLPPCCFQRLNWESHSPGDLLHELRHLSWSQLRGQDQESVQVHIADGGAGVGPGDDLVTRNQVLSDGVGQQLQEHYEISKHGWISLTRTVSS